MKSGGAAGTRARERIERGRGNEGESTRAIIDSIIGGCRQTSKQAGIPRRTPDRPANPHSLFNLTTLASGVIKKYFDSAHVADTLFSPFSSKLIREIFH